MSDIWTPQLLLQAGCLFGAIRVKRDRRGLPIQVERQVGDMWEAVRSPLVAVDWLYPEPCQRKQSCDGWVARSQP